MDKKDLNALVEEIVNDECYDMTEEVSVENIVKFVSDIVPMLFKVKVERIKAGREYKYIVKVKNDKESYVSMSDDEQTGVSRSVYYIFENPLEPTYDELKTFIEMINEAWYLCNN